MNPIIMDEVNTHTTAELDILQAKLGETTDTGGTEKMGTLFAKLNALINVIAPSSGHEEFTTPGTYSFTVPGNVKSLNVTVIGAGGGGGGGSGTGVYTLTQPHVCGGTYDQCRAYYGYRGTAGGNGANVTKTINVTPGTALTIIVGAGGAGGSGGGLGSNGGNGTAGGASSINNYATASGGNAGSGGSYKAGTDKCYSPANAVSTLNYAGLSNYSQGGNSAIGGGGHGGAGGSTYYLDQKATGTQYGSSGGKGRDGKVIIEW